MISEADILLLHQFSVADYGGATEIRDHNLLLSAINRPFQTFAGNELYPGPYEKAAALGESLIINHPFADGNKRTAMLAMLAFLLENNIEVVASNDDLYIFVLKMATGENRYQEIVDWLKSNTRLV